MSRNKLSMSTPSSQAKNSLRPHDERPGEEMDDDLRALKALRILLESRLINQAEYERRLESFQRRLEKGKQTS